MKGVKMFQITKRFNESYLAGITITEVMPFEMPVGNYPAFYGSCAFEVVACEKVVA